MPCINGKNGRFVRQYRPWSLNNFDNGFINSDGRFVVYLPGHHRSSKYGYVFRSIVAYELYHNCIVSKKYAIHHKNGDKLDDSKGNLGKIIFGRHTTLHRKQPELIKYCVICGKMFMVRRWEDSQGIGKYCSKKCRRIRFNKRIRCAVCKKIFWVRNSIVKGRGAIYCSRECWSKRVILPITKQKVSRSLVIAHKNKPIWRD